MTLRVAVIPRRFVITGASGFFGWHLRCRLHAVAADIDVIPVDRATFDDDDALLTALRNADGIIHLAGANRGESEEIHATNVTLAERLVAALDEVGGSPQVVYANTRRCGEESAYGMSKLQAARILESWANRAGAIFANILFPNLFGEHGRPDYNSAIATFVRDLGEGRASDVNDQGSTELLHIQAASAFILDVLASGRGGRVEVVGKPLSIPDAYRRLRRLHSDYRGAYLPELRDRLDLELFNSLRAALFPTAYPMELEPRADERGVFVEVVRGFGRAQTSFSTTRPGVTRGGHYHFDKVERFIVLEGEGLIRLRRLLTEEVVEFAVTSDLPVAVDMPTLHTHDITNVGGEAMLTVFWANDHFDFTVPDTYGEPVALKLSSVTR